MGQPGKTVEAFEELQTRLEQQVMAQSQLLQISMLLSTSFDLTKTMPRAMAIAQEGSGASIARVVLQTGIETSRFGTGDLATVAQLDEQAVLLATDSEPLLLDTLSTGSPLDDTLESAVIWPLQKAGHRQGILWLGYKTGHTFGEDEKTFLATLAELCSVAVANAYSVQRAQNGRKWLEGVLGSTTDPVLVVNGKGHLSLLNHAASDILALDAAAVIDQPLAEVMEAYPALLHFFEQNEPLAEDEEWQSPDGRFFSPRISRVEDDEGATGSYVMTLREITAFKLLNRNQAEFVRLVSHDLRSPLTYMQGFASLIGMTGELNERQEAFVEKILGGISQMTGLVDNIQDAGRWDPQTGFYEMSREPTDLAGLVQDIVSNHQDIAAKQKLELIAEIAPNIPIVNIDSLMVERGLNNLVSNAIKYSPNGGQVTVSMEVKDEGVLICVSDTGLGIAEEHLPQLFERGVRVVTQEIKHNKIKGSGLGLFIVRSVARRHGGDVWVESTPGEGSQFYFNIPLIDANLIGGGR